MSDPSRPSAWQTLLDAVGDGFAVLDRTGRVVRCNVAFAAILDRPAEQIVGRSCLELIPSNPEFWPFASMVRTRTRVSVERSLTGRWFQLTLDPVSDNGGAVVGGVVLLRDITERKKAEERSLQHNRELTRRADELQTLLDVLPVCIAIADDRDCRRIRVNPAGRRLLGLDDPQANASLTAPASERPEFRIVRNGVELPADQLPMQRSAAEGVELLDYECDLVFADGRRLSLVEHIAPLFDERGRSCGCVGAFIDITERKRVEEELRRSAASLAEADRRKDAFLAMLGHELRNPLAPIRNALYMLREQGGDRGTVNWARDLIDRQVRHLTRLVDDLLDVAGISNGRFSLRREVLDFAALVRAVAEDGRAAVQQASLRLEVDASTPVWVDGDSTRLAQVAGNLLNNAVKFSDPGGRIAIRVTPRDGLAVLTVRDTGIGFAPSLVPQLFQTFAQGERLPERNRGGLGLGLALVQGLVKLHGGTVEARSDGPGRGAEFTVRLPLAPAPREPTPLPPTMRPPARKRRVLMIEDNRDAAFSLQIILELAGHEVSLAHTGPAGLEAARRLRPDVVLCDLGLPEMDGYAVATALRDDPNCKSFLVAMSGYGTENDQRRAREAGFDVHLTKPVDPTDLERLLRVVP